MIKKMVPGFSTCDFSQVPQSISFSGSGFMATYQLGVAQCFLNYAPWILRTAPCVLGASAGSLVAAAVVCEVSFIMMRDEMLRFAKQMKAFTLGPFNPSVNVFHWLECILHKYLPSDVHRLASGRLAVTMTRLTDGKHVVMSEFQSKEDVVQALLCSCFVPGYCGIRPPSFRGVYYMDGGFSNIQPILSSHTLTVSPFSGEIDICPADAPSLWDVEVCGATLKGNMANCFRMINALYPTALETLEQAYHSGYRDAINFLLQNGLAPYFQPHKPSQGPLNCNGAKTWMHLDTSIEDEEEMKVEKKNDSLICFTYNCKQMHNSNAPELTRNRPVTESTLNFDAMKNVLLGNVVSYLSMFGLPARILSYLLLPLVLSFYTVLQRRHRLEMMFMQAPKLVFWAWHSLKCSTLFVFSIFIGSLRKNVKDRVSPIILFLQWLNIHARYEAAPKTTASVHYRQPPA